MTKGELKRGDLKARVGPDGWESAEAGFAASLNSLFPVGGTPAGVPWIHAFWAAARDLGLEVVTEPVADPAPPDRIY